MRTKSKANTAIKDLWGTGKNFCCCLRKLSGRKTAGSGASLNRGRLREGQGLASWMIQYSMPTQGQEQGSHMQDKRGVWYRALEFVWRGFFQYAENIIIKLWWFRWPQSPDVFWTHPCLLHAGSRKIVLAALYAGYLSTPWNWQCQCFSLGF